MENSAFDGFRTVLNLGLRSGRGPSIRLGQFPLRLIEILEIYGAAVGVVVLILVSACAVLLGRKAARQVDQFREEHHQGFTGRPRS